MTFSSLPARRATAGILLALCCAAAPLAAQAPPDSVFARRSSPFFIKYGKWVTLAAALGMGLKAADAHHDADRAFARLERYCNPDRTRCDQRPNGNYLDPTAESYYQASLHRDRNARAWLLGGEVTLLGAAGMFVWELSRPKHTPKNIPFEPEFRVLGSTTRIGINVPF